MGMFDQEIPGYVSGPQRIRRAGSALGDQLAPGVERMTGYVSPKRKTMAIANSADLSSMSSIEDTYKQIQKINPTAASAWLKDAMSTFKADTERRKISTTSSKDPAVFKQKIADIRALNIPEAEKLAMVKKVLAGGNGTTVNVGAGASEYDKTVGKLLGTDDVAEIKGAEDAVRGMTKTNRVMKLLAEGKVTTGFGAGVITDAKRVLSKMGFTGVSADVSDTQLLTALLGSDVFPMIKTLGIGARGLDTVGEREFLIGVMTGETKLEGDTLKRMTAIRQDLLRGVIEKYNAKYDAGGYKKYEKLRGYPMKRYALPALSGVDPKGTVTYGDFVVK